MKTTYKEYAKLSEELSAKATPSIMESIAHNHTAADIWREAFMELANIVHRATGEYLDIDANSEEAFQRAVKKVAGEAS